MAEKMGTKLGFEELLGFELEHSVHAFASKEEFASAPWIVDKADQFYYYAPDGSKFLDFISVLFTNNLGIANKEIIDETFKWASEHGTYFGWFNVSKPRMEATYDILNIALKGEDWPGSIVYRCTGSEAVESAVSIAKLYTDRQYVITRQWEYHGTLAVSGRLTRIPAENALAHPTEKGKVKYFPFFPDIYVAPLPYCYRCPLGHEYPGCKRNRDGILACVKATEDLIMSIGEHNVAAMITEVVNGAASCLNAPLEYFEQLVKMLHKHGVLWIDDEVICGFGKTAKWFAYQHYPVKPDIMVLAKSLGGGSHFPLSGVVVNKEIANWIAEWRFANGGTWDAMPISMKACALGIEYVENHKLMDNAPKIAEYFDERLKWLKDRHVSIGHITGLGLMRNLEFVKNRETREPFVPEDRFVDGSGDKSTYPGTVVMNECLMHKPTGLFVWGGMPNSVGFCLPLTMDEEHIDEAIEILDDVIGKKIDPMVPRR